MKKTRQRYAVFFADRGHGACNEWDFWGWCDTDEELVRDLTIIRETSGREAFYQKLDVPVPKGRRVKP